MLHFSSSSKEKIAQFLLDYFISHNGINYNERYICFMQKLNRHIVLETIKANKSLLSSKFHVSRIGLFGSFARDEATDKSDLDFLVEFDVPLEKYISNRYALIDYLMELFGREVDVANPKSLKPFYKEVILKHSVYA